MSDIAATISKPSERNILIDNYRGCVMFIVFVWSCTFSHIEGLPLFFYQTDLLKKDVAFGIQDYGIAFFLLASGITMKYVFDKKAIASGAGTAHLQSVKRAFGIAGIGMIDLIFKDIIEERFSPDGSTSVYGWEAFGTIGFAVLFATIFINTRKTIRLIAGSLFIIIYALAFGFISFFELVGGYPNMSCLGPFGAIPCSGMLMIFSVAGELLLNKEYLKFFGVYIGSIICAIPSLVFTILAGEEYTVNPSLGVWGEMLSISFYKSRAGFEIFAIPVALTTLIPLWGITELCKCRLFVLADMGRNTIIFYFTFILIQLLTKVLGNLISYVWLDISVSLVICIGVCFSLNFLLTYTNFYFTI